MIDEKIQIIKDDEIDLRALFQVLWNDRKLILKITGFITFLGILYALLATPLYKSTITMYPSGESSSGLSQYQGMASMFGINMGGSESTFHIPDIINSRTLQTKIIYKKWDSESFDLPVDLISYWGINDKNKFLKDAGDKSLEWETSALKRISNRISINEDKTGLISVNVLMEESELSAQIANFIYEGVVELTNVNHNEKATLNREFIEGRQLEVKAQLIAFEEVLKIFRERNRSIMDSPQLQLEVERLLRDVEIQTQVFITLQQQYELARIEEVKEMPSVVVLDKGFPSVYKDSPKRKLILIICMFMGGFFGIFIALIKRLF